MGKHKDEPASIEIAELIQAAGRGDIDAAAQLGDRYREGNGVPRDDAQALHWYTTAAERGDPYAQDNLGSMLLRGIGCRSDSTAAVHWYRAAAEQGNATAQFNPGVQYLSGDGVEQSYRSAGDWFGKAALHDHAGAMREFGTLFQLGYGTERDLVVAAELHMNAIQAGDTEAAECLASYHGDLTELALSGNREAAFRLCRMYDWGLGVAQDKALCWAWLRWGHDGCASVPPEEERSEDVDIDVETAFRFFLAALDAKVRQQGEDALAKLLGERGRRGATVPQTILKVGAEGGFVTLRGLWTVQGWRFLRELRDGTPTLINDGADAHELDLATSWRGAVKLLDQHPWHRLTPLRVHPEFAEQVWRAYQRRVGSEEKAANSDLSAQWKRACYKE